VLLKLQYDELLDEDVHVFGHVLEPKLTATVGSTSTGYCVPEPV
jgi:hypothetical protein